MVAAPPRAAGQTDEETDSQTETEAEVSTERETQTERKAERPLSALQIGRVQSVDTTVSWCDTGFDRICAHCPAIEPKIEDQADAGDGICLHAFAYSCAGLSLSLCLSRCLAVSLALPLSLSVCVCARVVLLCAQLCA